MGQLVLRMGSQSRPQNCQPFHQLLDQTVQDPMLLKYVHFTTSCSDGGSWRLPLTAGDTWLVVMVTLGTTLPTSTTARTTHHE
jgi:hypothetical protein